MIQYSRYFQKKDSVEANKLDVVEHPKKIIL